MKRPRPIITLVEAYAHQSHIFIENINQTAPQPQRGEMLPEKNYCVLCNVIRVRLWCY